MNIDDMDFDEKVEVLARLLMMLGFDADEVNEMTLDDAITLLELDLDLNGKAR